MVNKITCFSKPTRKPLLQLCLSLALLQALTQPLAAEPAETAEPPEPLRRWSLELVGGVGPLLYPLPAVGLQAGYTLPVLADRLQAWLAYSPWSMTPTGQPLRPGLFGNRTHLAQLQSLSAGGRWTFNPQDDFRYSALLGAGLEFTPGGEILQVPASPHAAELPAPEAVPAQLTSGILMLGAGVDLSPLPWLNLGGDLLLGVPSSYLLRFQLRAGVRF